MGTPASLLDMIAKGGSLPGYNEAQQSQANTALTNAQVRNVPIQGQLMQSQIANQQAEAESRRLANQQIQQQLDAAKTLADIFQSQAQGNPPASTSQVPPATAPSVALPNVPNVPAIATPGFVNGPGGPPASTAPRVSIADPNSMLTEMLRRGVPYPYAVNAASQMVQFGQNALKLTQEQRQNAEAIDEKVGSLVQNLQALPAGQRTAAFASEIPQLEALDPSTQWRGVNPDDDQQLRSLIAAKVLHGTILAQAKEVAATGASTAQAEEAHAGAAQKTQEAKKLEFENSLLEGMKNPASIAQTAEKIAPAAQYPDLNHQLGIDLANAQSIDELKSIRDKYSEKVLARTPETVAAEANKAYQVAKKIAPIEEQKAEILAEANHARQVGDVVGAKYYESLADQRQSLSTANTIQKVLDLSKQGNAVAGAQLKALVPEFTNAIQDIKRMASSQGDKGLASAQDHLASEIASIAEGKPLSDKVQAEIAPYVQTIANGATARHNAQVEALKTAYPKQAQNLKPEVTPFLSATGPNGHQIKSSDGGRTWFDAKTGAQIQ